MKQTKKGGRRSNVSMKEWNSVYPDPVTQSSMVGRYSRYPGMFLLILILIGVLAGITPAGNAYIDLNNLTRTAAGIVWLKLTVVTAVIAMIVYWSEDRFEAKSKKTRY